MTKKNDQDCLKEVSPTPNYERVFTKKNKRQIFEGQRRIKIERCKFLNRSAIEY